MLRRVVWQKLTDVSDMFTASTIALMMEAVYASQTSVYLVIAVIIKAVRTSEMPVYYETTRRYIPEGHHLPTCLNFIFLH
jgi:hypothetical protein